MAIDFAENPHHRFNILTNEWVLVSPHRTKRPWQGKQEDLAPDTRPSYDPKCYLCPGNKRASGDINPSYEGTYAFINDYGALIEESNSDPYDNGLLKAQGERGICKVICFSPDHALTLADMEVTDIKIVVDLWCAEYKDLGQRDFINHVQIFENKGAAMGCSNPHPHGQIWAQSSIPTEIFKKGKTQKKHWNENSKSLLEDYLDQELSADERIIYKNDLFVALVPFWAVWPYEVMILPRRKVVNLSGLTDNEKLAYAQAIKAVTVKFDKLFSTSFPYSAGIHQSPTDGKDHDHWHMHMSFYPPLLRSATVKKFMVGYEMFATPQRDITAEMAAAKLKAL